MFPQCLRPSLLTVSLVVFTVLPCQAQLLNELMVNPNGGDEGQEFVELKGPASLAMTGYYFASVEGDFTSTVGAFDRVVDLGGSSLGTNGLLIITTDAGNTWPSFPAATTHVEVAEVSLMENGTTSFLLIRSPTTPIVEGTDYDTDNDGTLDALPGDAVLVDGIGWSDGGGTDVVFGTELVGGGWGASDMATRFEANFDALSAAAWYYGDQVGANNSVLYDPTQVSGNFPVGGMLTPGDTNVPLGLVPVELMGFTIDD